MNYEELVTLLNYKPSIWIIMHKLCARIFEVGKLVRQIYYFNRYTFYNYMFFCRI